MPARRKRECVEYGCREPMYSLSLCKAHFETAQAKRRRRDRALDVLHYRIEETTARRPGGAFGDDWAQLRTWFRRACNAIDLQRSVKAMPIDEADNAIDWSISLAAELLEAEDALGRGEPHSSYALEDARKWVGDRFRNLEGGLMSNGIPRPPGA